MLSSEKESFHPGEIVSVKAKVSTGGHLTAGVDLVVKYDSSRLEATPGAFIKGEIFDDYPPINIDPVNGIIRVSGIASDKKIGFNGSREFGTFKFRAKGAGEAEVSLGFSPNSTSDSNIFDSVTYQCYIYTT